MNWTKLALGIVKELIRISTAIDGLKSRPANIAECAERIRTSTRKSQELATRFGMVEGQTPRLPSDEIRTAWRMAIPGPKRCGAAVQASAHEIAFCNGIDAFNLIVCYFNIVDATLVESTRKLLDATLDRQGLRGLEVMIRLEGEAAKARISSEHPPRKKPGRLAKTPPADARMLLKSHAKRKATAAANTGINRKERARQKPVPADKVPAVNARTKRSRLSQQKKRQTKGSR